MDIRIRRSGSQVQIVIEDLIYGFGAFTFTADAGSEWTASLLVSRILDRLDQNMTSVRENAYRQGWKDAKAKRAKSKWFSPRFRD